MGDGLDHRPFLFVYGNIFIQFSNNRPEILRFSVACKVHLPADYLDKGI